MKYLLLIGPSYCGVTTIHFPFQIAVPMSMEFDEFAKQRESGADETNSKFPLQQLFDHLITLFPH